MHAATIRGNFVTLLAQVDDAAILQTMFEQCLDILGKSDPLLLAGFPPKLFAELDEAIAQSDDESQAISNKEAFQLFRQWENE